MRALVLHDTTGPDALALEEAPEPEVFPGTVAFDVHAAGVGFVDWLVTRGEYQIRPPLPFVGGIEAAGTTADGRRVAAPLPFGAFAERAAAPEIALCELPDAMSFADAAALMINHQTAHLALARRGRLAAGETVLVHGAAGGVGLAAIQVARALGAGRVVALGSTEERRALALQAGATEALDPASDWVAALREAGGAHVVVDPVGGDAFDASLRCMAPEGRILVIGFASGRIPELAVNRLLLRHLDVVGVNFGGMLPFDPGIVAAAWSDLCSWWEQGLCRPVGVTEHAFADGPEVIRALGERRMVGKPVLRVR